MEQIINGYQSATNYQKANVPDFLYFNFIWSFSNSFNVDMVRQPHPIQLKSLYCQIYSPIY